MVALTGTPGNGPKPVISTVVRAAAAAGAGRNGSGLVITFRALLTPSMEKIAPDNKGELSLPLPTKAEFRPGPARATAVAAFVAAHRVAADCEIRPHSPAVPSTSCGGAGAIGKDHVCLKTIG